MKKIKLSLLSSVTIAALLLSSCAGLTKMRDEVSTVGFEVKPNPVEAHAGQVSVTIDTRFPEKYFNKKAVVVATPVLRYSGGEVAFPPTTLQGESVEANNKMIPYAGGSYSTTVSVPYSDNLQQSQVVVKYSAQIKEKPAVTYESAKIADGVVATSTLVQKAPKSIIIPDKFQRVIPETYTADIHYVINQSNVRTAELRQDYIASFQAQVKAADTLLNKEITGITISAYASPDGPVDLNTKLSDSRESSAQKYLEKALKDNKITSAEAANFLTLMSTPEDWEGFRNLMEKSNIQDKDLILRVLSMYSDPVVREQEIKNIAQAYKEIADEILPQLRRSVLTANVDVTGKSDSEISDLARSNPPAE
jgi:outer membrane protein OmpA-like peptidoglycan-associated protein